MNDPTRPGRKFPLRLDALGTAGGGTGGAAGDRARAPAAPAPRDVLRPQAPLRQAQRDAAQRHAPRGLGLDSADVRRRMVERLRESGIRDERVLGAMARVPRHCFVDAALVTQAYEDTSLPIGLGQTISKPSVVARMIELLLGGANARRAQQAPLGRVLEIGTGCGYQAAVLGELARQVVSVERLRALHDKARELLAPLRPPNLRLVYGDGMRGHPPNAPYDAIVSAAGGDAVPEAWLEQLAVGGRLVTPLREPGSQRQVLMVIDRHEHGIEQAAYETVRFVPLKSGLAG
jgi:protein-L-isoaspartate(D-aspartate) O-methyltransferase